MSKNKIKMITNPGENIENNSLFLTDEGEDSRLAYKDSTGKLIIVSNSTSSIEKPIHCSELYYKLKNRAWNKMDGTRFINIENGSVMMSKIFDYQDNMPNDEIDYIGGKSGNTTYNGSYPEYSESKQEAFYMHGIINNDDTVQTIESEYSKLFGNMNASEEVYFHNSSKNSIDILTGSVTLDYIKYNSDTYTDTVSLVELISYSISPGITARVDLTIQYSRDSDDDRDSGGLGTTIRTTNFTFTAFKYITNSESGETELVQDNLVEEFEDDIEIEYINGVIRVAPLVSDVNECIINKCTVTYGNVE